MALIKCSDCNHDVSDKAAACINCGAPTSSTTKITQQPKEKIKTIQETSKRFKLQSLLSVLVIALGVVFMFEQSKAPSDEQSSGIPAMLIFFGLTWYLINRFRIWWNHK